MNDLVELIQERGRPQKFASLCLIIPETVHPDCVLIGRKRHKFGYDKKNGPGGKQKPHQTIEICAIDETKEESGLELRYEDLERVGETDFYFMDKPEWDQTVVTYRIKRYPGEPKVVSDEIWEWEWYPISKLMNPQDAMWDQMWPGDRYWWPPLLQGKKLKAQFIYGSGEKSGENVVLYKNIEIVESLK